MNCRSSPVNISLLARVFDGDLALFQEGQDTGDPARVVDVLRKLLGRGPPHSPTRTTNESCTDASQSSSGPSSMTTLALVLPFYLTSKFSLQLPHVQCVLVFKVRGTRFRLTMRRPCTPTQTRRCGNRSVPFTICRIKMTQNGEKMVPSSSFPSFGLFCTAACCPF